MRWGEQLNCGADRLMEWNHLKSDVAESTYNPLLALVSPGASASPFCGLSVLKAPRPWVQTTMLLLERPPRSWIERHSLR